MTQLEQSARRAAHSRALEFAARLGYAARGLIYLVIAWLTIQIAVGHSRRQANQRGALAELASQPLGTALLWLVGAGFLGYSLWRFSEAAFGTVAEGGNGSARLKSLIRGVVYLAFAISTFLFLAGQPGQPQKQKQQTTTAALLREPFGRWLVGVAGLVFAAVGLYMVVSGAKKRFEKNLDLRGAGRHTRNAVVRAGVVGEVARGAVFVLVGALVVDAAVTFEPKQSSGLDGALRTLAQQSYGPVLLWLVGLGLAAFGLHSIACARWAKVSRTGP
jgi:Domain of Unknown Function (DUF1206)